MAFLLSRRKIGAVVAASPLLAWAGKESYEEYVGWRDGERLRILEKASTLACAGCVVVRASPATEKAGAWQSYLPWLERSWQRASKLNFDAREPRTWPRVENGRAHAFTHIPNDQGQRFPIDVWSHYEAQAVLCALVDPSLQGRVHFGAWRTHWRLRCLLGRPLLVTAPQGGDLTRRGGDLTLLGEKNGWGIVVFPTSGKDVGEPTPRHAHVDGGRAGILDQFGVGCFDDQNDDNENDLEVYRLLALQLAFAIYCCTPGDLTPARGATGIYESSHLVVIAAIRERLDRNRTQGRTTTTTTWRAVKHALNADNDGKGPLAGLRRQLALADDEMLLVAGPVAHGTMFATDPMPGPFPRVIMNPKCFVKPDDDDLFSRTAARALKAHALPRHNQPKGHDDDDDDQPSLSSCVADPKALWLKAGHDADDFHRRVRRLVALLDDAPSDQTTNNNR